MSLHRYVADVHAINNTLQCAIVVSSAAGEADDNHRR